MLSLKKRKIGSKANNTEQDGSADSEDQNGGQARAGSDGSDGEVDHLHGFSTDEDSSDEEFDAGDTSTGIDLKRLPTIAKDDETVKRKLEKAKRQPVRSSFISSPLSFISFHRRKIVVSYSSDGFRMVSLKTSLKLIFHNLE